MSLDQGGIRSPQLCQSISLRADTTNVHVPHSVQGMCSNEEKAAFNMKYGTSEDGKGGWPLYRFIVDYTNHGSQPEVLQWIGAQKLNLKPDLGQAWESVEERRQPPRLSVLNPGPTAQQRYKTPNWLSHHEDGAATSGPTVPSLTSLFPEVTEHMAHRWRKAL